MALSPYTAAAEVRALLGVSDVELSDAKLELPIYAIGLRRDLREVSASLPADFLTVDTISPSLRTEVQQNLHDATYLFASCAVARQAGATLGMMSPKSLTDDKAGFDRFADSPYRDVLARLENQYQAARKALARAVADYAGTTTAIAAALPPGFRASSPTYDPVVGDAAG